MSAFAGLWLWLKKDVGWGLNLQRGREWIVSRSSSLSSDVVGKTGVSMMVDKVGICYLKQGTFYLHQVTTDAGPHGKGGLGNRSGGG